MTTAKANIQFCSGQSWGRTTLGSFSSVDAEQTDEGWAVNGIPLNSRWNPEMKDDRLQWSMPLAVYKSLIQKMVRQDDDRLGHVVTLGVQCLEAPVADTVDPNARI